jgi:hypothetical protein
MYSFRRLALLLALASPVIPVLQAQSPTSSSTPADPGQQAPAAAPGQTQTQPQGQTQTQPQISVAARIKARREQRRAAAIHEVYDHLYEIYVGAGYLRFTPGATLQRVNEYDWNVGFTRYFNERLGATIDGRGYYGTPFIEPNLSGITKPAISQYGALIGPTYRFYLQPKYSISGRVMAGYAQGNFTGDTNGFGSAVLGLYPDGGTFAVTGSIFGEYNLTPNLGFRVAPEYYLTGFGSKEQNNLGYNIGIVYRFGKQ